ncbi:type I glyceraldehyde-3-phosphate dehydrogenase [Candidatus Falkowbacteria bacterium]|jgi:glyceraldehyde 3-phosphate dehydrogenase|nr:type I glyceraldehyde-3-phosphate dehydrogenase [Candidatus Falkowbacteria bacterium]MBT7006921.1 type I glyceraldehyde-3-phosphate dehydrogenase [Candidatus Falkowbacteria bacterium]
MIKIAINGFGRIGRAALKIALTKKNVKVVAINDLADLDNLAYLLKYDSVYGRYDKSVKVVGKNIVVGKTKIPYYQIAEPNKLPWKKLKVDVALECTGVFKTKKDASRHLKAGAKNVIISAPAKGDNVATIVKGVNHKIAKDHDVLANASCTTNCVSPVMAVLEANFGIEKALLTTIHGLTASQRTVDLADKKDWRRGRAAGSNMIPTTTGAALATALVLPSLKGKFDGMAVRVPLICGSMADVTVLLKKDVTEKQINQAFIKATKQPIYKGILETTTDPIVSTDILGNPASSIVDLSFTKVVGGNLVKVCAWYDNEWGYANRLVEMASELGC